MKTITVLLILVPLIAISAETEIFYLENGMQVALIENHAAPVIASSIVVRAGLRDEEPDMYGASHLLEHLLFNGTTHRTQEELYEEMDMLGGYNNAHTGENFANYVILMNKNNFEKGLEIQCDMLFNSTLPNAKFVKEKGIVSEEIGGAYDRASYAADIHFYGKFFKGTPYECQVLGSRKNIEDMKRERILRYYKSRYIPNNMLAIITGDFNSAEIKPLLEKYLGAPPAGIAPERKEYMLDLPDEQGIVKTSVHYERSDAIYLRIGLPAPHRMGSDFFTAEMLSTLLSSRLNDKLTGGENALAQSVSLEYNADRDFGAYIFRAKIKDEKNIDAVISAFKESFRDLSRERIRESEVKNNVTSERIQALLYSERPHFYAMMKAYLLAFHDYTFVEGYYDNLLKVTPADVRSLAGALYADVPFVPVVTKPYPEKMEMESAEESETGIVHEILPNGMELIVAPGSGSGVFAMHFLFKNRSATERMMQDGITNFLHNMLVKGTKNYSGTELEKKFDEIGMKVEVTDNPWIPMDDYRTTPEYSYIRVETSEDSWKDAMDLSAEFIKNPSLNPEDIEAVRGMMMGAIGKDSKSASAKSKSLFMQKLLGGHVLTKSVIGNMGSIAMINRDALVQRHDNYISPYNMILSIVSDVPPAEVAERALYHFGAKKPVGEMSISSSAPSSSPGEYKEELGKMQSYIRMGYLIEDLPEEDEAALTIASRILSDKMSFQLRERQGLAYTMGAYVSERDGWGYLAAYIGTAPDNIQTAIDGMKDQIKKASEGRFTEREVTTAVNSYLGRRNMRLLLSANRAMYLGIYAFEGKPLNSSEIWEEAIRKVTVDDVNRVAQKYFRIDDDLVTVVVE